MTRILVRTYRDPFAALSAEDALELDGFGGANNGNLLFSDAAVRTLAVEGTELHQVRDDARPDPAEVNESYDHLVLPLANAFSVDFVERLRDWTTFIERLNIPVTVLGVGAQGPFDYDVHALAELDDDVRAFVGAVLDRSPSIAVRGAFTADYLAHLGFGDVEVVGCPSMFSHGGDLTVRERSEPLGPASKVAFNLNPRLPLPPGFVDRLVDRYPRLVYFPQNRTDLLLAVWGRRNSGQGPGADPEATDHPLWERATTRVHVSPEAWVADLAGFDVSFGTRIHGNVAAVLGGTPVHLIAHDSRTRELAEHFELPFTRAEDLPEDPDLERLTAGDDAQAVARGHAGRFERYLGYLDAHALPHRWADGARPTWQDAMADRPAPGPAEVGPGSPLATASRMGWLRRRLDHLEQAGETATERHEKQREKLRALRRQVKALEQREQELTTTLAQQQRAIERLNRVTGRQQERLGRLDRRLAALEDRQPAAVLRRTARAIRRDAD